MGRERLDPVDLMMLGRMDEAAAKYLEWYAEAREVGDAYIGPLLLKQLHLCVAGMEPGRIPEEVGEDVERMVTRDLRERGLDVDVQDVKGEVEAARQNLVADRKNAERISQRWV